MQPNNLFEYAVIRIVPQVEREEFLNAGIILYCARQKFLQAMLTLPEEKLKIFCMEANRDELQKNLDAINHICMGDNESGPIGKLDIAARFRWLTAIRSTIIQTSKVHPGFCINAGQTLTKLYNQLVL